MGYPDSREQTFIDGVTDIPGDFLNKTQDEIIRHRGMLDGSDFFVQDDFVGSTIDTGKWSLSGHSNETIADDSANGAFGAAKISIPSGNTNGHVATVTTLPILTADFTASARVRLPSGGSASQTVVFGVTQPGGGGAGAFFASAGTSMPGTIYSGRWAALAGTFAMTQADTGLSPTNVYQHLEIKRVSGMMTFNIDGTTVASFAMAGSITGVGLITELLQNTSAHDCWIDDMKLWVAR